jgi:uncharacterized protein with PIN domain
MGGAMQANPMANTKDHFNVVLSFSGDLGWFVKPRKQGTPIFRVLSEKTSVKDVIESCGVPHPEVDLIVCNGEPVDFSFRLESDTRLEIYPATTHLFPKRRLQQRNVTAFVADGHLGKLARQLRLLGIDVAYRHDADDRDLLATMTRENRALLTRDRPLLMHRIVKNGHFPRSHDPIEQTVGVIRRFDLSQRLAPFTRCLRCNGLLISVPKESVIEQLEPLTRLYYKDFQKCSQCDRPYWHGSHVAKLYRQVELIVGRVKE